jgi:hypothetical protein
LFAAAHDRLSDVEEAKLDEVVIEERRAAGKTHARAVLHDAGREAASIAACDLPLSALPSQGPAL